MTNLTNPNGYDTIPIEDDFLFHMDSFCPRKEDDAYVCLHPQEPLGDMHAHDFFEINFVLNGNFTNLIEEQSLLMTTGDFLLIHPNVYHNVYGPGPNHGTLVNILIRNEWFLSNICKYAFPESPMGSFLQYAAFPQFYRYIFFQGKNPECIRHIRQIITSCEDNGPCATLFLNAKIIELLCAMLENSRHAQLSSKVIPSKIMMDMLSYIQKNYSTVTLEQLAEHMNYSSTHICRLFKKYMHTSFSETLMNIRLTHAKSLLLSTKESSQSISRRVGYDSVEYFHRLFRERVGCTPGEYRKNAAQANVVIRQPIQIPKTLRMQM